MDINDLRILVTVASFIAFLGIVWWAYTPQHAARFESAAMLPFADDEPANPAHLEGKQP